MARNATPRPRKKAASVTKKAASKKGYNPLAPERVHEILAKLNERYPDVTCALIHKSAWGVGGRNYSFCPIHRCGSEQSHAGDLQEIPNRPGFLPR